MLRRSATAVLVTVLAVSVLLIHWDSGPNEAEQGVSRWAMVAIVLALLVLPLLGRGPLAVAPDRVARAVRLGGYLSVWVLLLSVVMLTRYSDARFDPGHGDAADPDALASALVSAAIFFALFVGYAAGVYLLTARRRGAAPATLAPAAWCALAGGAATYALTPFGNPLRISGPGLAPLYLLALLVIPAGTPVLAAYLAGRQGRGAPGWTGQSLVAGVLAAGGAAVVLTALTLFSMRIAPGQVHLLWANPDPYVPHGTPFELRMTLGDTAAKYLPLLILAPLAGLLLGAVGVGLAAARPVRGVMPAEI